MAKPQSRRSISIRGSTYRRLKERCDEKERSVSGWIEEMIAPYIKDIPDPNPGDRYSPRAKKVMAPASGIFTF